MSKAKLDKDYANFNSQIEKLAEDEIKSIREKAETLKEEAKTIGLTVQSQIGTSKTPPVKEKG